MQPRQGVESRVQGWGRRSDSAQKTALWLFPSALLPGLSPPGLCCASPLANRGVRSAVAVPLPSRILLLAPPKSRRQLCGSSSLLSPPWPFSSWLCCASPQELCVRSAVAVPYKSYPTLAPPQSRWTAAGQASLSLTLSWSLFKFMPTESVTSPNHRILCGVRWFCK